MITKICHPTNLYTNRDKNDQTFKMTEDELMSFLALLILSGYHTVPGEHYYWSTGDDFSVPIFRETMPRERFKLIKRYLHLVDNEQLQMGKMSKVDPFYDALVKNFQQFGIFHNHLSIDEEMIPYHGHHSAKMFIKMKPIKFGFKLWMLCSADGFPYNIQIYTGKSEDTGPLGQRVVIKLLECVTDADNHIVYFDNFFTNHQLMVALKEKGFRACGTVRDNRMLGCSLISVKEMKKKERGAYDHYTGDGILYTRWNDSSVVTVASNYFGVQPLHTIK